ncbi:MAG TPA: ATP-binding cassette domain-containing protein [Chloroflexia bacterium]|nr:ATP-binding cassette domain-containing protein [Chloroflexia bacterium]
MLIAIDHLTYTYPGAATPALHDVQLHVEEGEFLLLAGESGAGKSTLLRALNGLVPHFYGGQIGGRVRVAGHDPVAEGTAALSAIVGLVFQDPEAQVVADTVEDELAFAMENAGLPPALMRKRIAEVIDQLSIAALRGRRLSSLSGGERQRVAIGAVLTLQPRVLALDEPTSQLDPQAAEEVLDTLVKLNKDLGLTIVLSEHRLERVVQHVDRIAYLYPPGTPPAIRTGPPGNLLATMPLAPPLVEVARALGWHPIPLNLKDARRFLAQDPRFPGGRVVSRQSSVVSDEPVGSRQKAVGSGDEGLGVGGWGLGNDSPITDPPGPNPQSPIQNPKSADEGAGSEEQGSASMQSKIQNPKSKIQLRLDGVWFAYGGREALRGLSLEARPGEVLALMGRNGAGKTTVLKLLVGLLKPSQGRVLIDGHDTRRLALAAIVRQVGYVPQRPDVLLFADTVREELAFTRTNHGLAPAGPAVAALLAQLHLSGYGDRDPQNLSAGERQRVALAAILAAEPGAVLLDEPTRGLDYRQKAALSAILRALADAGRTIVLATHDVELAAQLADRVALLDDGQVIVEGPAREVMAGSLVFASQVNKLFRDPRLLTAADVRDYLARAPA